MNKKIIKAVVLLFVFLGTVVGISLFTDTGNVNMTSEMSEATLPVVYLKCKDYTINELYGYKGEMNPLTMRDTITPLAEDLILPVTIQTHQSSIDSISYAIRKLDMERLLEEKQVSNYTQKNGMIEVNLKFQNLMELGEEYMLILKVESGGDTISYYTRIIRPIESYVEESLEFVLDFHNKTFEKEKASELAAYLEPNKDGDNTTLQRVTIHSSLEQVAWGSFEGKRLEAPVPSVKEISSYYVTVVLKFIMAATGENDELEYYNVEEYFRVRYGGAGSRMFLLGYERTMNEIFRGNGALDSEIQLGIRNPDVHFMANESGTVFRFVQEGELWGYNANSNQLSRIFSFRETEGINGRENNPNHDIRILKTDETGSMDFVVFGYMNRGNHEGAVGIGVYHYDSVVNTIEEVLFVNGDKSYQALKEDWGKLFYISNEGMFYMIADSTLYRMDLNTGKEEEILSGLHEDNYAVSGNGRYIAWGKKKENQFLTITDLEGETQSQITSEEGEVLVPIGFIENDFVYGAATIGDKSEDGMLPMHSILIIDEEQNIEYKKSANYIADASVDSGTIFLDLVTKGNGGYIPIDEPTAIKRNDTETEQNLMLGTLFTEVKQTQVKLIGSQVFQTKNKQILTPKEIVREEEFLIDLKTEAPPACYHVYVGSKIILCTEGIKEAIQCADANAGVVIGNRQEYIWSRRKKPSTSIRDRAILHENELADIGSMTARCLTSLLQIEAINLDIKGSVESGKMPKEIMQEALSEDMVLDLSGCNVKQVLYYVDHGTAVFALGENKEPLLIVGYDEHNTILYDPETNTTFKKGLQDSDAFFSSSGNYFLGYIRKEP